MEGAISIDIHSACYLGDENLVEEILRRGTVEVNEKNSGGWTPLMYACWSGCEKLVTLLQNNGARKDEVNSDKQTPLIVATKSGCLNIVKLVFQENLLPYTDDYNKCALFYAVDFGYYDISSYLLGEGADANFSCDGMTVLMAAVVNGHRSLVELLLEYGADIYTRNHEGFTAQQIAVARCHFDIADMLDPNYNDLPDLQSFLGSLGLEKYFSIFQENQIHFEKFLQMDEVDLKAIGIKLLGPRRKMSLGIASFKKRHPKLFL